MARNAPFVKIWMDDRELQRALKRFEPAFLKKIHRKAAKQAAKPMEAAAKQRVPNTTGRGSGDGKKSIKRRPLKRSRKYKHTVGSMVSASVDNAPFKGDQFYLSFLELGAPRHMTYPPKGTKAQTWMGAVSPLRRTAAYGGWMHKAMKLSEPQVRYVYRRLLPKIIQQTAKQVAGKTGINPLGAKGLFSPAIRFNP